MTARIGFYGGVGSVTGANFMLETESQQLLVDCGLVQGDKFAQKENAEAFGYDPSAVDTLFVTHAHADHIGRIPKLVKDGFKGTIYSTPPTHDLAEVMFEDAYVVMSGEAEMYGTPLLYEREHIGQALALWKTIEYQKPLTLKDSVEVVATNAGHILGSSFFTFSRNGKKIMFTGDIGNVPQPLLDHPTYPSDLQYMVMESVYGDRVHEEVAERSSLLLQFIERTIKEKGTLIIPAFSLERTQAMLFEINNFVESKQIEPIPTFLDSPLAIRVTEIYRRYTTYLKSEVQEQIEKGDDIFAFPRLSFTPTMEESNSIAHIPGPKIIIAGSGMSHGGRVRAHEKLYLGDPRTTVVLVGFQTVGSVGRLLQDGVKKVTIDKEVVHVRARIEMIRGYSGHADRDQLVDFVSYTDKTLTQVFVTMGEEKASLFLVQRLRDYLGVNAVAPEAGSVSEIDF